MVLLPRGAAPLTSDYNGTPGVANNALLMRRRPINAPDEAGWSIGEAASRCPLAVDRLIG